MTSKLIVNNIEADAGVSTITFGSEISASKITTSSTSAFSSGLNVTGVSTFTGDIISGSSGFFYDYSTGRLGVGIDPPGSARLHVKGHSSLNNSLLVDVNTGDSTLGFAENGTEKWRIENVTSADALRFYDVTNTAERLRITNTGNVGIGTDTPTANLEVKRSDNGQVIRAKIIANRYGDIRLESEDSGTPNIVIGYARNSGNYGTNTTAGDFSIKPSSARLHFPVGAGNASSVMIMADTGHVTIPNGNLAFSTSGTGIDFSATANGSGTTNSELFDDYEEGSFTPQWGDASGGGGTAYTLPTYNTQRGDYTKIGNVVYYDIHLITTAWNGAGSIMWVYGLPFASRSSGYQQGGGGIFCVQGVDDANAISTLTTQVATSATRIELYYQTAATGNNYNVFGTGNVNEAGTVSIRINGFYFTNS